MPNLILRPSGLEDPLRAYTLQLRSHESVGEVEYRTLCRVGKWVAGELMRTGQVSWHGPEPWED